MAKQQVPEGLLKKRQRDEQWATNRAAAAAEAKAKSKSNRKLIFKRAEAYVKEYRQQVRCDCHPSAADPSTSGLALTWHPQHDARP